MLQRLLLTVALSGSVASPGSVATAGNAGGPRRLRARSPKVLQVRKRGHHAGVGLPASQSCEDRRSLQQGLGQPRPVNCVVRVA